MHLGQSEARHARVPGGKRAIEARIGAAVAEEALLLAREEIRRLKEALAKKEGAASDSSADKIEVPAERSQGSRKKSNGDIRKVQPVF